MGEMSRGITPSVASGRSSARNLLPSRGSDIVSARGPTPTTDRASIRSSRLATPSIEAQMPEAVPQWVAAPPPRRGPPRGGRVTISADGRDRSAYEDGFVDLVGSQATPLASSSRPPSGLQSSRGCVSGRSGGRGSACGSRAGLLSGGRQRGQSEELLRPVAWLPPTKEALDDRGSCASSGSCRMSTATTIREFFDEEKYWAEGRRRSTGRPSPLSGTPTAECGSARRKFGALPAIPESPKAPGRTAQLFLPRALGRAPSSPLFVA